jgi:hypothetical protein
MSRLNFLALDLVCIPSWNGMQIAALIEFAPADAWANCRTRHVSMSRTSATAFFVASKAFAAACRTTTHEMLSLRGPSPSLSIP